MRMISVLLVIGCALVLATSAAVAAPMQGAEDPSVTMLTDLIHTEVEAIWNRQMSMLIGNTVILGAIKLNENEGSPALNKALTWAGLILCFAWFFLDWQGWYFSHILIEDAQKAAADLRVNPFLKFPTNFREERIFYFAMSVVGVFFAIYIWLLAKHGWWMFWKPAETKAGVAKPGTA